MTNLILIRVNCPTREEAEALGTKAIEARLAGCANVEGPVTSIYHWEGRIERDEEYVLWLKAPAENWAKLNDFLMRNHSFDTPAVLAIPCIHANPSYEAWLDEICKDD